MDRLRATASAARSVLDRREHDGTLGCVGKPIIRAPRTIKKLAHKTIKKPAHAYIIVCDSKGEGRYVPSTAIAEAEELDLSDRVWNGNTRALIRMVKCWQDNCNVVPLKSFMIERLAADFLFEWEYHLKGVFYYDWMVRDFFAYLISRANGYIVMPGGEMISLGSDWLTRAQTAYRNAVNACHNDRDNYQYLAGEEWQKIFGSKIPQGVL